MFFCLRAERKKRRQEERQGRKLNTSKAAKPSLVKEDNQQKPSADAQQCKTSSTNRTSSFNPSTEMSISRKTSNSSFTIDNLLQIPSVPKIAETTNKLMLENLSSPIAIWPRLLNHNTHSVTQPMGFIVSQQEQPKLSANRNVKMEEANLSPSTISELGDDISNQNMDSKDLIDVV